MTQLNFEGECNYIILIEIIFLRQNRALIKGCVKIERDQIFSDSPNTLLFEAGKIGREKYWPSGNPMDGSMSQNNSLANHDYSTAYASLTLFSSGPLAGQSAEMDCGVNGARFELDCELAPLFPYINAVADQAQYHETPVYIKFLLADRLCAFYSTNKQISRELNISQHTVKSHVIHIFNKIGVNDRAQASAWGAMHGVVDSVENTPR
jgi:hypothetical protein